MYSLYLTFVLLAASWQGWSDLSYAGTFGRSNNAHVIQALLSLFCILKQTDNVKYYRDQQQLERSLTMRGISNLDMSLLFLKECPAF